VSQFHVVLISRYLATRIAILSTQPVQSTPSHENVSVNANVIKLAETKKQNEIYIRYCVPLSNKI